MEADPLSQWLYKALNDAGLRVMLTETRLIKKNLKSSYVKTDKRDAGRSDTGRNALMKAIIGMEQSVRGILCNFGPKMGKN
ncbi:MAG: hypothetical protein GDA36_07900 [Rhodobacteraceae bacterium]|nr:hypothetical protein [Paracoccaceae bacterium]